MKIAVHQRQHITVELIVFAGDGQELQSVLRQTLRPSLSLSVYEQTGVGMMMERLQCLWGTVRGTSKAQVKLSTVIVIAFGHGPFTGGGAEEKYGQSRVVVVSSRNGLTMRDFIKPQSRRILFALLYCHFIIKIRLHVDHG